MIIETLQEFCTFFKKGQPIISIDYGTKKIGLAISSPDHRIALPFQLIAEKSERRKLFQITDIIKNKNICIAVVGLPLNMNGTEGDQCLIVRKFISKLEKLTDTPIFFQDERLTSKAANSFLKMFNIKRQKRNSYDDLTAASMILETALDSRTKLLNSYYKATRPH